MYILNQDRDKQYEIESIFDLQIGLSYYQSTIIGYNILYKGQILGTFDTYKELLIEISRINNCKYRYYIVSGFNDYKE